MYRNLQCSGRWFSGWRVAGLLLVLALGFASAAQAAPGRDYSTRVYLWARRVSQRTICVGDQVPLAASVIKAYEIAGAAPRQTVLAGVRLEAAVSGPNIGSLAPASTVTAVQADPPGVARFTFTAEKAGATTITVKGTLIRLQLLGIVLNSDTVMDSVAVTVEKCEYRVNATAIWRQKGDIGDLILVATIENAALVPDPGVIGHYHGTADVKWVGIFPYKAPCHIDNHPPPSAATLTGEVEGNGLLKVTLVYLPTPALSSTLVCPEASTEQFASQMLTPQKVSLWVPTGLSGSLTFHPDLAGVQIIDGLENVDVRPVPGQ